MNEKYQIAEYNQTVAALSILREKYGRRFDVTTTKGMNAAREARAEVRGYRTSVEKLRAELKAPLLERGKLIDADAKRITAELASIEEPIDAAIKAEERRKEEEKAAKARAEAERVARINARLLHIRRVPTSLIGRPASEIEAEIARLTAYQPDPAEFTEFLPEAIAARNEVCAVLETMLIERKRADEEQARIQAEREELERLRQQDEERKAEQRRIEAEAKAKADAEAAAIRKVQEAESARIAAAQRELDERQRKIDEEEKQQAQEAEAKKARNGRSKKASNPLEELASAVPAGLPIFSALKMAYDMGYEDGVVAAKTAKKYAVECPMCGHPESILIEDDVSCPKCGHVSIAADE